MWSSGDQIVVRYRSVDGRFLGGRPVTVVEDGADWLVTYQHAGTVVSFPVLADGRGLRDVPLEERWSHPRRRDVRPWHGPDLVLLFPRSRAYSIWIFRDGGGATEGWYVNLEEPHRRTPRTLDTRDSILDIWAPAPDGEPEWKDEHELEAAARVGRVTPDEARAIRAEGERVWRERPWPTGWEEFAPPPDWPVAELPAGWYAGPLETERLVLAPLDRADLADLDAVYGDAKERELEYSDAAWTNDELGFWGVRDRDGELVAVAETSRAGEGIDGIAPDEIEVGWVVRETRRNEGIATEAMRAVLADLRERTGVDAVAAYIRPGNEASRRVAEKLGMRSRGPGHARNGDPAEIFELAL